MDDESGSCRSFVNSLLTELDHDLTLRGAVVPIKDALTAIATALQQRDSDAPRFLILKGGPGSGKSFALEYLFDRLGPTNACQRASQIDVHDLLSAEGLLEAWRSCFTACGLTPPVTAEIADFPTEFQQQIAADHRAKPLFVFVEHLEHLQQASPRQHTDALNLFFLPLVRHYPIPVVIVAAARHALRQPISYLPRFTIRTAIREIRLEPWSDHEIIALVTTPEDDVVGEIVRVAQGHPGLALCLHRGIQTGAAVEAICLHCLDELLGHDLFQHFAVALHAIVHQCDNCVGPDAVVEGICFDQGVRERLQLACILGPSALPNSYYEVLPPFVGLFGQIEQIEQVVHG